MYSVYKNWKINKDSIRIIGEKYSHSCPIKDFLLIIDTIHEIYNNVDDMIFTYADIKNYLIQNEICNSLYLKRNKYKITVALNILLLENLIVKKSKKGPYQIINIDELVKFRKKIEEQVSI